MIIKTKDFQNSCKCILTAVDASSGNLVNDALEVKAGDNKVILNVTNGEYYASVSCQAGCSFGELDAVVDAKLFLSLVAKMTVADIELEIVGNVLVLKGNGEYKLPMLATEDGMLKLDKIGVGEEISSFSIDTAILSSINKFNSKELLKSGVRTNINKMFYVDETGCITFGSGACVNEFSLPSTLRILLTEKLVRLFGLFKTKDVGFTLGVVGMPNGSTQQRVRFKNDFAEVTAIVSSDAAMLDSVPAKAIRALANKSCSGVVEVDCRELFETLSRLSLFAGKNATPYSKFVFDKDTITVYDTTGENKEVIKLVQQANIAEPYECTLNAQDLMLTLDGVEEQYVTVGFGDHRAVVVIRPKIKNVLAECRMR